MKKLLVLAMSLVLSFAFMGTAWSEGWASGLELGGGAKFELVLGEMTEHETGGVGFDVDAAWPLPLGLPDGGLVSAVGLSAQAGVFFPVGVKDYVDSWWALDFAAGAYVDLRLNRMITLRPGVAFDIRLNNVNSPERKVTGTHADYGAKIGVAGLFDFFNNGIILKAGADYVLLPEREALCQYLSFSLGAAYRFK